MPEMHYRLRWPDSAESTCYSPSLVIKDHLEVGAHYPLPDFLQRIRTATRIASERVRAKYGMPCSRAIGELGQIELRAATFAALPGARIEVVEFME